MELRSPSPLHVQNASVLATSSGRGVYSRGGDGRLSANDRARIEARPTTVRVASHEAKSDPSSPVLFPSPAMFAPDSAEVGMPNPLPLTASPSRLMVDAPSAHVYRASMFGSNRRFLHSAGLSSSPGAARAASALRPQSKLRNPVRDAAFVPIGGIS